MKPLLLDTCALLFLDGGRMRLDALNALRLASEAGAVAVSPFSAWEVAMLVSKRRLQLTMSPSTFFEGAASRPGAKLAPLTPAILIASNFLPGDPPADPADRIMAATAREFGYTLVTRDRALLEYAEAGHINAIEC